MVKMMNQTIFVYILVMLFRCSLALVKKELSLKLRILHTAVVYFHVALYNDNYRPFAF